MISKTEERGDGIRIISKNLFQVERERCQGRKRGERSQISIKTKIASETGRDREITGPSSVLLRKNSGFRHRP